MGMIGVLNNLSEKTMPDVKALLIPAAILYAVYKFVPNTMAKTAAVAVGAVLVAKQVPFLSEAIDA